MADKPEDISIHVDSSEQRPGIPPFDESIECPDHPGKVEMYYGLAGGGVGVYTFCATCGRILSKDQDSIEE